MKHKSDAQKEKQNLQNGGVNDHKEEITMKDVTTYFLHTYYN